MKEILYRLLEHALEDFYAQEQRNLQLNVHEICHGHRLAIYFENRIREYDNTHREKLFENYSEQALITQLLNSKDFYHDKIFGLLALEELFGERIINKDG